MRRLLTQLFEGTALGDTTSLQNEPAIAGIQDALRDYAAALPASPLNGQK
jgi:acetyl-CoA synthetase